MTDDTLTATVLSLLRIGDHGPMDRVGHPPRVEITSDYEHDVRDWGMVFGLAYGIARGQDPYESAESVSERAAETARQVWAAYFEPSHPRPDQPEEAEAIEALA